MSLNRPNLPLVPKNSLDSYRAGVAALERHDFAAAVAQLEQVEPAAGAAGVLARYYLDQARTEWGLALLREHRFAEAAEQLRAAHALNPSSAELCDYLARACSGQELHDQAAEAFRKANELDPDNARRVLPTAWSHWRHGERDRAIALLNDAAAAAPDDPELHDQLGLMRMECGDAAGAIAAFEAAVQHGPHLADAARHLGLAYGTVGRMEDAARMLTRAARLRPDEPACAMELALVLKTTSTGAATQFIAAAARGVASGAGTISEEAILPGAGRLGALLAEEPELVDAFLTLPQTERDAELFAALESAVRAALSHHPEYADLRHYAACVQSRLGRLERAVEFERAALAINPGYVAARVQLGRTLAGLNRLEEAIVEFEQAVAQGGDYADVYFELGELHRQAGHTSEARQAYERALRLNQSFDRAQRALQSMAAA